MHVKLDAIVFDCADAPPLARFWAAALGWQVAPDEEDELSRLSAEGADDPEDDPSVMVEPPEDSGLPVLFFTEVAEEKAVKNRLHIDLVAEAEIPDEIDRLESLGASCALTQRSLPQCFAGKIGKSLTREPFWR